MHPGKEETSSQSTVNAVVSGNVGARDRMIVPTSVEAEGNGASNGAMRARFLEIFMTIHIVLPDESRFARFTRLHSVGEKTAIRGCVRRLA